MNQRPASQKLEAILKLAKSDIGNRRKSPWRWIISGLILCALVAGFFFWVGKPRPAFQPFALMASDAVGAPEKPVSLIARIEPSEKPADMHGIAGTRLIFQETIENTQQSVDCDRAGFARFERSFAASDLPITWFARYAGVANRGPAQARGIVYIRPRSTAWLIVDADHALPAVAEQEFWTREGISVPLAPGALVALRGARAKREIVYVATSADSVNRCLRLKSWLARGWAPAREQPPDGPLLARAASELTPADFLQKVVKELQAQFDPPVVALAARPEEARAFVEAGARTLLLGTAEEAPKGAIVVKSWNDDLVQKLEASPR